MALMNMIPKLLLVDKVTPVKNKPGQFKTETIEVNVKDDDMEICAGFISKFQKLGVILVPYKFMRSSQGEGKFEKVPNTGLRIGFKAFRYQTKNSHMLEYILQSKAFKTGKIKIDDVDDPDGFWEKQGYLKKKTIQVVEKVLVPAGAAEGIDLKKAKPDVVEKPKDTEDDPSKPDPAKTVTEGEE